MSFVVSNTELAGRLTSLVMGTAAVFVIYAFNRRFFSERLALMAMFLAVVHPYLVRSSGAVLSEATCYALFTTAVFCAALGYENGEKRYGFLCGLLVALAYLTRPEFAVYAVPIVGCLAYRRRWGFILLFFVALALLALPYVFYISVKAGQFMLSLKQYVKALPISPSDPVGSLASATLKVMRNSPWVTFNFFKALFVAFLPFFAIGVFSRSTRNKPIEIMMAAILVTHVLSIAAITPSNTRYSVPLVPLALTWAALGIGMVYDWIERRLSGNRKTAVLLVLLALVAGSSLSQNLGSLRSHRLIHKEAGLWLRDYAPGTVVMSRVPHEAFYAEGRHVRLLPKGRRSITYDNLLKRAREHEVEYLVEDSRTVILCPEFSVKRSDSDMVEVFSIDKGDRFLKIYRLRPKEK
jgi:4-amino-4-deoxy-L-arabinose transferase-like glycosyltransferase